MIVVLYLGGKLKSIFLFSTRVKEVLEQLQKNSIYDFFRLSDVPFKLVYIVLIIVLLSALVKIGEAQEINSAVLERSLDEQNYFQVSYDNDLFRGEDYGNTQNIGFELVRSKWAIKKVFSIFPKIKNSRVSAGFGFEHAVYTPQDLASKEIQLGDYPYAAYLVLKAFKTSCDTVNKRRFIANASIGFIGPLAGGKQMQTSIHQTTGDVIPQGWVNQLNNDLLLNYSVIVEQQLLHIKSRVSFLLFGEANIGSLNTSVGVGAKVLLGMFQNSFESKSTYNQPFQIYLFASLFSKANAYDATLQGGFFSRESSFVIDSEQINRFQIANSTGLVLRYKAYQAGVFANTSSAPFKSTGVKSYGGVFVGKRF